MVRKIKNSDRQEFLAMSAEFYASDAVTHNVPQHFHEATFDELMASETYLECYLLEADGKIAGYALLAKTFSHEAGGKVLWLEELYVRREYRSKGLGKEFFSVLEARGDAARLRLEVEPKNDRAKSLYRRMGFKKLDYEQFIKE